MEASNISYDLVTCRVLVACRDWNLYFQRHIATHDTSENSLSQEHPADRNRKCSGKDFLHQQNIFLPILHLRLGSDMPLGGALTRCQGTYCSLSLVLGPHRLYP